MAGSNGSRVSGWCALAIILSLYVVGAVSHGVIRHIVQTAPLWMAVWMGMKRSDWAKWAAFPSYLFWLAIAIIIWCFLLGWTHMINGTFSPIEIAMTIVFASSCLVGMGASLRSSAAVAWVGGIGVFVVFAFLQWLAFRISFLPHFARDPW